MEIARARLKAVFRKPGCALCHLRLEAEQRYYSQLLFDQVNDGGLRLRLARSIGFCPTHTRGLLKADMASEPPGLGFAILHAAIGSLLHQDLAAWLGEATGEDSTPTSRMPARRRPLSDGIARLLPDRDVSPAQERLLARLSPAAACPACESLAASEQVYLRALVRDLTSTDLEAAYGLSDGLCLEHLRRAVRCARDDETVTLLVRRAAACLEAIAAELETYMSSLAQPDEPPPAAAHLLARAAAVFAGDWRE